MTLIKVTYRNKIDAALGLTPGDVEELRASSRSSQQRTKQKARWAAHLERKKASA